MTTQFHPSTLHAPLTLDADPKAYVALGKDIKRGDPAFIMSRGELVRFSENPWKWLKSDRDDATKEMQWGSAVDCMALTPERFKDCYEVCPETYEARGMQCPICKSITDSMKCAKCKCERVPVSIPTPWNWNADACNDWREMVLESGRDPIKITELEQVRIACARLMEDPFIGSLFAESQKQVQCIVEYRDKDTGVVVQIKTLLDLVPSKTGEWKKFLADLKTANDASVQPWEKAVFNQGYHVQAALYADAFNAVTGENRSGFLHVVQESASPYAVARRMLADEFMDLGRDTYKRALRHYCQCLKAQRFPGYDDTNDNNSNPIVDGWRVTNPSPWMIAA